MKLSLFGQNVMIPSDVIAAWITSILLAIIIGFFINKEAEV
ncbi:hypothetical protein [Virgibacillus salexigens]|nr:hypothetical protein [Virgibacillus salexigens]